LKILKLLMVQVASGIKQFLDLLHLGSQSNWWGLSCPAHCGAPSITSLLLALTAGVGLGFSLAVFIALFLLARWTFPIASSPSTEGPELGSNLALSRLQGYVNARRR